MTLDAAQTTLFGEYPRAVGVTTPEHPDMALRQYLVHSKDEMQSVIDRVHHSRNIYSSISAYLPSREDGKFGGCGVLADKVSFDLDSSAKAEPDAQERWMHGEIPDHASDSWIVDRMRSNPNYAEIVLGDVCDDARRLVEHCSRERIPVFGVFSGTGLHIHQLYQPTLSRPGDKMASIARRFMEEGTLATADPRASGKPFRIMRMPNIERVCHSEDEATGLYTIPLRGRELLSITPEDLIELSYQPRPEIAQEPAERPEMKVQEDYLGPGKSDEVSQSMMRPLPEASNADAFASMMVKKITQMPCVWERAVGSNPPNDVRVKLGIMFLNAGYSPEETTQFISRLGWVDFNWDITHYQIKRLAESGKGDWSCKTMQAKGLCVRADEKTECPTYGYKGGNQPW